MVESERPERRLTAAEQGPKRNQAHQRPASTLLRSTPPAMRIRLKLLLLLLTIAVVPLVMVTWFDLSAARRLGLEISGRAREVLEQRAHDSLLASARDSARLLRQETKLLETAARLQAQAVGQALAGTLPLDRSGGGSEGVAVRLGQGVGDDRRVRLAELAPTLAQLREEYAPVALWQRIALEDGTVAVYPAHPAALESEAAPHPSWYERVRQGRDLVYEPPHPGALTGQPIITVAAPVFGPRGQILGAAAIDVPVGDLLGIASDEPSKPAHVLIIDPSGDVVPGPSMRIAAERRNGSIVARGERVLAADAPGLDAVLTDMVEGRSGVRQVHFKGEDTLWAYANIDQIDTHLAFVVPYHEVIADALAAQTYVTSTLARQRTVLLVALAAFIPLLVGLAIFASRAVTRPLNQLAKAARRLAAGDFAAHTDIRSGDELEELGRLFNIMAPQLFASIRMRDSLALAQELQRNLLPHGPPDIPGLDIAGVSLYCDETGGDYYDFLALPELGPDKVAVMIGDVAGHGISAALLMTTARALLRSRHLHPGRLAHVVGQVNTQLCADSHAGRFMTLFLAVLDVGQRTIHWIGAGHDPGIIYDPQDGTVKFIDGQDIPLGVDPDWHYHEMSHTGWNPGTVLLIGTDGISETRNPAGEMFGRDAALGLIRANAHRSAAEIVHAVTDALGRFRGASPQRDDVTLVVVKAVG